MQRHHRVARLLPARRSPTRLFNKCTGQPLFLFRAIFIQLFKYIPGKIHHIALARGKERRRARLWHAAACVRLCICARSVGQATVCRLNICTRSRAYTRRASAHPYEPAPQLHYACARPCGFHLLRERTDCSGVAAAGSLLSGLDVPGAAVRGRSAGRDYYYYYYFIFRRCL